MSSLASEKFSALAGIRYREGEEHQKEAEAFVSLCERQIC